MSGAMKLKGKVAPHLKAQGGGKIVNVSSQAGLRGNDTGTIAHYCIAKAGIAQPFRLPVSAHAGARSSDPEGHGSWEVPPPGPTGDDLASA